MASTRWLSCFVLACSCSGATGGSGQVTDAGPGRVDEACPVGCSVGEKCTVERGGATDVIQCVPDGNVAPGGDCSHDSQHHDNCAAGALCTSAGLADTSRPVCRAYCATDADCSVSGPHGAQFCQGFALSCAGDPLCGASLPGGICMDTCAPFSAACGPNGTCSTRVRDINGTKIFVCRVVGLAGVGSPCVYQDDCGPDTECVVTGQTTEVCEQSCDASRHGCPAGKTCKLMAENGVGLCQ